jgi:hypothetical protein
MGEERRLMSDLDPRRFEVVSPLTGTTYHVEFRWMQTGISLRNSDTVDVKFLVNGAGRIVALPHGALERACRLQGVPLRDELCVRLAAEHLGRALENGEDDGAEILTVPDSRVQELLSAP